MIKRRAFRPCIGLWRVRDAKVNSIGFPTINLLGPSNGVWILKNGARVLVRSEGAYQKYLLQLVVLTIEVESRSCRGVKWPFTVRSLWPLQVTIYCPVDSIQPPTSIAPQYSMPARQCNGGMHNPNHCPWARIAVVTAVILDRVILESHALLLQLPLSPNPHKDSADIEFITGITQPLLRRSHKSDTACSRCNHSSLSHISHNTSKSHITIQDRSYIVWPSSLGYTGIDGNQEK